MKSQNGVTSYYGTFKDLKTARHERDVCVACEWDFDRIVEFED